VQHTILVERKALSWKRSAAMQEEEFEAIPMNWHKINKHSNDDINLHSFWLCLPLKAL